MPAARRLLSRLMRLPTWVLILVTLLLSPLPFAPAWAQQDAIITPLGALTGGSYRESEAYGLSSDGSVVVGASNSADGFQGVRWTAQTGLIGLGTLLGSANAASANGSVVVGQGAAEGGNPEARVWTSGGVVRLGYLTTISPYSYAYGVSANGSVVVGVSKSGANTIEAFRWTSATGMVALGDLAGGAVNSQASSVTPDGSVVVGQGTAANGQEAFRWTATTGMVGLGDLPGGSYRSGALDVSADGSVVVGFSSSTGSGTDTVEAFRWTSATGMVGLGFLPGGYRSAITAVSADGSVLVGDSNSTESGSAREAILWTSGTGMVCLKQYLLDNYAGSLPSNFDKWTLESASDISADGSVITGTCYIPGQTGQYEQAYRIRLPNPTWRAVDVAVERTDNTSRLLWKEKTGRYAVWKLSATGTVQTGKYYGPLSSYECDQIAVGPNGQAALLWKNALTRRAELWTLAADLSSVVKNTVYNYPAGYTPQNIAIDASNNIRLTLRRTNGQVAFWTIAPTTGAITGSATYGPYTNLIDGPIAVGADGRIRLLWRNVSTGGATVWTIPSAYGAPSAGYSYNPFAGAQPADISVGADNKTRLQWRYATGKIALWKVNTTVGGTGAIEVGKFYGPLSGVAPLGLSVGGDNQTRQLWAYPTGKTALWVINDPLTTISTAYTYGPL